MNILVIALHIDLISSFEKINESISTGMLMIELVGGQIVLDKRQVERLKKHTVTSSTVR